MDKQNENFIKDVFERKKTASAHFQFIRYSIGEYEKEPFTIAIAGGKIKIRAGFEYVNPLQKMFGTSAEGNVEISGVIATRDKIEDKLNKYGVLKNIARRFGKSGSKYELEGTLSSEKFREFVKDFEEYYLLFDAKNGSNKIKVSKKETPKIGSQTDKFVSAEFEIKNKGKIIEQFLFMEKPVDFKKAVVKQTYIIEKVLFDEKLIKGDPEKARLLAVKKGKVKRTAEIDGKTSENEFALEA